MKEERNTYIFTTAGWKHLETDEVVQSGGIPLDAADIKALKELHLQEDNGKEEEQC